MQWLIKSTSGKSRRPSSDFKNHLQWRNGQKIQVRVRLAHLAMTAVSIAVLFFTALSTVSNTVRDWRNINAITTTTATTTTTITDDDNMGEQCVRWFMTVDLFVIQFNQISDCIAIGLCAWLLQLSWSIFVFECFFYIECFFCCVFSLFLYCILYVANKRVQYAHSWLLKLSQMTMTFIYWPGQLALVGTRMSPFGFYCSWGCDGGGGDNWSYR